MSKRTEFSYVSDSLSLRVSALAVVATQEEALKQINKKETVLTPHHPHPPQFKNLTKWKKCIQNKKTKTSQMTLCSCCQWLGTESIRETFLKRLFITSVCWLFVLAVSGQRGPLSAHCAVTAWSPPLHSESKSSYHFVWNNTCVQRAPKPPTSFLSFAITTTKVGFVPIRISGIVEKEEILNLVMHKFSIGKNKENKLVKIT